MPAERTPRGADRAQDRRRPPRPRRADYPAPPEAEPPRAFFPRPRWRTVILSITFAALVAGALVLLNSPLLEIRSVTVSGTNQVGNEAVRQLSALQGEHILLADLAGAQERILRQPLIKTVSIRRVWPNGVRIEIEERTPWAGWQVDDEVWAIDADGVVLEGLAPPAGNIIVRQVSSLPAIRAGARVDLEAIALIRDIQERGGPARGPRLLGFEWSLRTGLTVITQHGRITFGGADGLAFKYQVWEQLEWEAQRRGEPLLLADLRFGTRPQVEIGLGLGRVTRILEP